MNTRRCFVEGREITFSVRREAPAKLHRDGPERRGERDMNNRAKLARNYPGADLDELVAQQPFLDRVEEVRAEVGEGQREKDYGEAILIAARRFPTEYDAYCGED